MSSALSGEVERIIKWLDQELVYFSSLRNEAKLVRREGVNLSMMAVELGLSFSLDPRKKCFIDTAEKVAAYLHDTGLPENFKIKTSVLEKRDVGSSVFEQLQEIRSEFQKRLAQPPPILVEVARGDVSGSLRAIWDVTVNGYSPDGLRALQQAALVNEETPTYDPEDGSRQSF